MSSTPIVNPRRFAGSRQKTCCGKLAGCACRRPDSGITSIQNHFSGNFSANLNTFSNFNKCKVDRCKIKCQTNNMVLPLNNFKSTVNGRNYSILTDENLNCNSVNIIYLITCNVCKIQYVGETSRNFSIRMKERLYQIRKCENNGGGSNISEGSQYIYRHFCQDDLHRGTPLEKRIRFQIIEKVRTDDLPSNDPKIITKRRTDRELYWIAKLRTAYPLGLNDMINGLGIRGKATDAGFTDYNHFRISNLCDQKPPRNHRRKNRHRKKKRGNFSNTLFESFANTLNDTYENNPSKLENLIFLKSRTFLTRFFISPYSSQLNHRLRYILESRVNFLRKIRPERKETEPIAWTVKFSHKIFDDLQLNTILNNSYLLKLLPTSLRKQFKIRKVYSYTQPISTKILNYNKALKATGIMSYENISDMSCDCADSPFKNEHFGHIITGDLNIIREPRLHKLCSFGTKFRETPPLDLSSIKKQLKSDIDNLCKKIARKFKNPISALKTWRKKFFKFICQKLYFYSKTRRYEPPILSHTACRNELKRLQKLFIITVVDKASGNFAFTCKKFYYLKLAEELGLNNPTPGNDTYQPTPDSEADICDKIKTNLDKFKIIPPDEQCKLALLYQTPKFHKNPPKMRYIAGNVKTVTSTLDEKVALILKMCKSHFRNLCKIYEEYSGVKHFFDVETSLEVKNMFDGIHGKANTISINDFSTLYTLFDHNHLLKNMTWLLGTLSKNSGKQCIKLDFNKARWVLNANELNTFTITEIIEMIDMLIRGTYIKSFGHIFRQVKGMIMGGKSSGWLSDCSLMVDEFLYIREKISKGLRTEAINLKFFRRYRDDCTTLNCNDFLNTAQEIYPPSLSLTQENDSPYMANVLDMEVKITDNNCITKIYCKTDHFPFNVISLPYLESNIESNLCYKVFYSQLIRFQRLSTFRNDFEERTRHLAFILIERGYKRVLLERQFCRAVSSYISEFQKWSLPCSLNFWFNNIMDSTASNPRTTPSVPNSFSQPASGLDIRSNARTVASQP